MKDWYLIALVGVNAYFLVMAVANTLYLRSATKRPSITSGPFVSIIVPARDEAASISRCLESLLAQDYEDYEVVVVDDQSEDETPELVAAYEQRDSRLRLVHGRPLPDGWLGKPHALAQGMAAARGEILLLTDADTVHSPHSVSWAVTNLQAHRADMLSGYLDQRYGTFGEKIVVPTMYAMLFAAPLFLLTRTKSPGLSFAIGQYVVLRREALAAVGGFEAVRDTIVDDMSMAARFKSLGYREVFLDARAAAACRLYDGYREAFRGIERSVYSSVGASPVSVAVAAIAILGMIVGPAVGVTAAYARAQTAPGAAVAAVVLFAVQWAVISWDRKVPLIAVVLYPVVFLDLLVILIASMLSTGFGSGIEWKGRLVHASRTGGATEGAAPVARPGRGG